jgi:hypothetical protein
MRIVLILALLTVFSFALFSVASVAEAAPPDIGASYSGSHSVFTADCPQSKKKPWTCEKAMVTRIPFDHTVCGGTPRSNYPCYKLDTVLCGGGNKVWPGATCTVSGSRISCESGSGQPCSTKQTFSGQSGK